MTDHFYAYKALALESPSELFHEASKLRESDAVTARTVWIVNTSPAIKQTISKPASSYRGFPSIQLPSELTRLGRPFEEVLLGRRSARAFSGEPLALQELSSLLYYSAGVTSRETDSYGISWGFRCAPSGGALYPIDIYCVSLNVADVKEGLHAYNPNAHSLELLASGPHTAQISAATYLVETVEKSAVCILMVASFLRTKFKYGERGYRFVLLEAGHIAQNMLLVAESLGLGALPVGGYIDDQLNAMVGVDGCEQAVVYAVLIGRLPNKSE
jgi:SagB-type dehydrogenase family enzyme